MAAQFLSIGSVGVLQSSSHGTFPLSAAVTGCNRGLGLALADRLSEKGFRVVLTSRRGIEQSMNVAALLTAKGRDVEVYAHSLDVSNPRNIAAFCAHIERRGGIDILVNNAATCNEGWSRDVARYTIRTNVVGPMSLSLGVLPAMIRRCGLFLLTAVPFDSCDAYQNAEMRP